MDAAGEGGNPVLFQRFGRELFLGDAMNEDHRSHGFLLSKPSGEGNHFCGSCILWSVGGRRREKALRFSWEGFLPGRRSWNHRRVAASGKGGFGREKTLIFNV